MLVLESLSCDIEARRILENIDLNVKKGKFVGLIGANGSGKSTLLKNIYGLIEPNAIRIMLEGEALEKIGKKERAKKISVLAQHQKMDFDFSVREIVEMGRYAHGDSNQKIVEKSLDEVGMLDRKDSSFVKLSGGEKQRVLIARAFAQETDFLILDEPTNHLDIKYQLQIMDLIKRQKKTVLAVVHDMNIASSYCDYIVALKDGKVITEGSPQEIFTEENIEKIFGIKTHIITHPTKGVPYIIYL